MQDCNKKWTPARTTPLGTDVKGQQFDAKWDYATAIGMLLYLSLNSCPNVQFMVHQCAQFMHTPKQSHQQVVLWICHYLKVTEDKGLSVRPSNKLILDCYTNEDFSGLYNVKNNSNPICQVKNGFCFVAWWLSIALVVKVADQDCPQHDGSRVHRLISSNASIATTLWLIAGGGN